jgi:hypothetical protein
LIKSQLGTWLAAFSRFDSLFLFSISINVVSVVHSLGTIVAVASRTHEALGLQNRSRTKSFQSTCF